MQEQSTNSHDESEVIELPEQSDERPQSVWTRAVIAVVLVGFGASASYVMCFRSASVASGAVVADAPAMVANTDSTRLSEFLITGKSEVPAMRAELAQSSELFRLLTDYPQRLQAPLPALQCNPFVQPDPKIATSLGPTTVPSAVDTQHRQEAERAAMLQAVEAMQLQSISANDMHRSCMINNALYDEGGTLNGFVIEQINAQSVVIRNGLYRFELTMNH